MTSAEGQRLGALIVSPSTYLGLLFLDHPVVYLGEALLTIRGSITDRPLRQPIHFDIFLQLAVDLGLKSNGALKTQVRSFLDSQVRFFGLDHGFD